MMYLLKCRRNYIHILWILCISQVIVAQEEFSTPDSLKNKSYSYLFNKVQNNYTDTISSLIYLNASLEKAISENNLANQSYTLLQLSYYKTDKSLKLDLIERSIEKSKGIDSIHSLLPRYALGVYYYTNFEYEKALEEYIKILDISKKINYTDYEFIIINQIAEVKGAIGEHKEALDLYRKSFYYEEKKDLKDSITTTEIVIGIAESMRYLKMYDSASYYYNYIKEKEYVKDPYYINIANINQGINLYESGNFIKSEQLLNKGIKDIDLNDANNQKYYILSQFYLGKIYQLSNRDIHKTRAHFLSIDSLITNIIIPETRETYEFLISDYKDQGNLEAQLATLNKLIRFDSIVALRKIRTVSKLYSEYDTPKLLKSKELIIKNLENKTSILSTRTFYLIITIIFLIILFLIQYRRHRKYKSRFNIIISDLNNKETKRVVHSNTTSSRQLLDAIDEDTITTVLKKLDLFEEKRGFLQKDITLAILAKKCTTNTKYLPKIIHTHKNKTFINYINNLRIDYILKELRENTTLQKYTIETISEEAGFNTAESFARAFKKKTGIRPSYYIRSLKKKEQM